MRQRRRQGRRRPSIDGDRKRGSTAPACYRRTLGDDQGVLRPVSPLWRAGVRRGVGTGMAARSVVPSPRVASMRRVPPRASRRSSMLVRPLLRVRPVGQQQISGRTILRHASVMSPEASTAVASCSSKRSLTPRSDAELNGRSRLLESNALNRLESEFEYKSHRITSKLDVEGSSPFSRSPCPDLSSIAAASRTLELGLLRC
jgi:hypothetical protein